MFNDVFQLFIYILGKCVDFLFGSYVSDGVSLGSLIIVSFVFIVMLRYLLNIPHSSFHSYKTSVGKDMPRVVVHERRFRQ